MSHRLWSPDPETDRYLAWQAYLRDCPFKRPELDRRLDRFGIGPPAGPGKIPRRYTANLKTLINEFSGPGGFHFTLDWGEIGSDHQARYEACVTSHGKDYEEWEGEAVHHDPTIALAHAILAMYQPDDDEVIPGYEVSDG